MDFSSLVTATTAFKGGGCKSSLEVSSLYWLVPLPLIDPDPCVIPLPCSLPALPISKACIYPTNLSLVSFGRHLWASCIERDGLNCYCAAFVYVWQVRVGGESDVCFRLWPRSPTREVSHLSVPDISRNGKAHWKSLFMLNIRALQKIFSFLRSLKWAKHQNTSMTLSQQLSAAYNKAGH